MEADNKEVRRRPIDEIKDRYYQISKILLSAREGGDIALKNHPVMKNQFNV